VAYNGNENVKMSASSVMTPKNKSKSGVMARQKRNGSSLSAVKMSYHWLAAAAINAGVAQPAVA